ncbi:MAG: radical SAM protein [Anaerolineae bacterium]|jgi:radical SAM protein with 4Fe4S-binding SPASM domain
MISVTRLLCDEIGPQDHLRYRWRKKAYKSTKEANLHRKPIVVWNSTKACNLRCIHCYYTAKAQPDPDELTTDEAKHFIDNLADFGAPVLLFSGGEPIMRDDLFELGAYAVKRGLRTVISTNGTLIDPAKARRIKQAGFSYVGISLDGIGATNDRFRGLTGAYVTALEGLHSCQDADVRTGLRLTLNKHNLEDLSDILDLLRDEDIPRACFYHLVYAGRADRMRHDDLTLEETRAAVDMIFDRALAFHHLGVDIEILTVDNHADGPYLLQRVRREQPERYDEVRSLLKASGGNASGIGIAAVDHVGHVHADQFWQHHTFGNVRERPFGEIWTDTTDPLMAGLKDRKPLLKGRCSRCQYLDLCNGNFRVRAEAVHGDVWAPDPACYLTDEEIGL